MIYILYMLCQFDGKDSHWQLVGVQVCKLEEDVRFKSSLVLQLWHTVQIIANRNGSSLALMLLHQTLGKTCRMSLHHPATIVGFNLVLISHEVTGVLSGPHSISGNLCDHQSD